jgi:hypothetical protein
MTEKKVGKETKILQIIVSFLGANCYSLEGDFL